MDENAICRVVVTAATEVHKILGGPGLLEGVYEEALAWELSQRGLKMVINFGEKFGKGWHPPGCEWVIVAGLINLILAGIPFLFAAL